MDPLLIYPPQQPVSTIYPPPTNQLSPEEKTSLLDKLCINYNIHEQYKNLLWEINDKHIIVLCDDSGSMNTKVDNMGNSRWNELSVTVSHILEIAHIFDPLRMDIHFLNRPPIYGVKTTEQIMQEFRRPPTGGTPLISKLYQIEEFYRNYQYGKLLIIATDGSPTDSKYADYREVNECMAKFMQQQYNVSFLICTEQPDQIQYINNIDKQYNKLDVSDDYITELREIRNTQGSKYNFSYGDYIVKVLVGSINKKLDSLDETKLTSQDKNQQVCNMCTIS